MYSMQPVQFAPDYVRVGGSIYYVTWPRLLGFSFLVAIIAALLSAHASPFASFSDADVVVGLESPMLPAPASTGFLAALLQRRSRRKVAAAPPLGTPIPSFCKSRPSTYFAADFHLVGLAGAAQDERGAPAREAPGGGGGQLLDASDLRAPDGICHWKQRTATRVPFTLCTFDPAVDSQISKYIHKEGVWGGWKNGIIQDMLPLIARGGGGGDRGGREEFLEEDPAAEPVPEGTIGPVHRPPIQHWEAMTGRSLVLDIGANLGFYALTMATRGYDVIAVEATLEAAQRIVYSALANGQEVGGVPVDPDTLPPVPGGEAVRRATVWVLNNAAFDGYHAASVHWVQDNPGASWVTIGDAPEGASMDGMIAVGSVPFDDLMPPQAGAGAGEGGGKGARGEGAKKGSKGGKSKRNAHLPALDPSKLALIKMSAEGTDARVLHGLRRVIAQGRPPFIIMVYNSAHVQGQGCDNGPMVHALLGTGYRLYSSGVYYTRQAEVDLFIAGNTGRSIELIFVAPGVHFW